jgi:hypothetical protein
MQCNIISNLILPSCGSQNWVFNFNMRQQEKYIWFISEVGDFIYLPKNYKKILLLFVGNSMIPEKVNPQKNLNIGYGIIIMNYEFNTKKGPTPSVEAIDQDIERALFYIHQTGISRRNVCVLGYSLGCYPAIKAVYIAEQEQNTFHKLIIDAGFDNLKHQVHEVLKKRSLSIFRHIFPSRLNFDNIKFASLLKNTMVVQIIREKDSIVFPQLQELLSHSWNIQALIVRLPIDHNDMIFKKWIELITKTNV